MQRSGLCRHVLWSIARGQSVSRWYEFSHEPIGSPGSHGARALGLSRFQGFLRRIAVGTVLPTLLGTAAPDVRAQDRTSAGSDDPPGTGVLCVVEPDGSMGLAFPLQHTKVQARVSGRVAQVSVEQRFANPSKRPIEAIYVFPLPHEAAVNEFELHIAGRVVRGEIHTRQDAQQIYDHARRRGQVAALLDQERPNIFTQSIANIMPGHEIVVRLRYVETLDADERGTAFVFPTVVGPRYIPGTPRPPGAEPAGWDVDGTREPSSRGNGTSPDTDRVPDASRITPPVVPPSLRTGHDLEMHVEVAAGVPIDTMRCESHVVDIERRSRTEVDVRLHPNDTIPNKDFVLRWDTAGATAEFGMLCYRDPARDAGGTFAFLLQPPAAVLPAAASPKEMIFLLDTSGSMSGEPLAKVKAAVRWALLHLNPDDTFQIVRFSARASTFAAAALANTPANVTRGLLHLEALQAGGGTEMRAGIEAALAAPEDPRRLRLVFFMTDGYIGNETEILATVRQLRGRARIFAFGVGSSVNRYLLDRLAEEGRGDVDYVQLHEDTRAVVERFHRRVAQPFLTDIEIRWHGLQVKDILPERLPDLFIGMPLVLCGRYTQPGSGSIEVRGTWGREDFVRRIPVDLPARASTHEALPVLWARQKLESLTSRQLGERGADLEEEITALALEHRLVSAYTSFVAVDNQVVNADGEPVLVAQPVPIPQGVSYEGVFGHDTAAVGMAPPPPAPGLRQIASPGVMSLSRSAAKSTPAVHDVATPEVAKPADLVMTLEPARRVFRVGEAVEVRITLRNQGQAAVDVPQQLGFADGSLILWVDGRAVAPGISARTGVTTSLGPGASRTWTVRLPAEAFVAAGRYVVEIRVALPELAGANLAAPGATTAIDVR